MNDDLPVLPVSSFAIAPLCKVDPGHGVAAYEWIHSDHETSHICADCCAVWRTKPEQVILKQVRSIKPWTDLSEFVTGVTINFGDLS